jgi:chitinase
MQIMRSVVTVLFVLVASVASAQSYHSVNFQAQSGHYVAAESGGFYYVNANRSSAGAWETFELEDVNGGSLESGDMVHIYTAHGRYMTQYCFGVYNGIQQTAQASSVSGCSTEAFIDKYDSSNNWVSGTISSGDQVAVSMYQGSWQAENGGGARVMVALTYIGAWEKFFITIW